MFEVRLPPAETKHVAHNTDYTIQDDENKVAKKTPLHSILCAILLCFLHYVFSLWHSRNLLISDDIKATIIKLSSNRVTNAKQNQKSKPSKLKTWHFMHSGKSQMKENAFFPFFFYSDSNSYLVGGRGAASDS